jgi:hypothetical protein
LDSFVSFILFYFAFFRRRKVKKTISGNSLREQLIGKPRLIRGSTSDSLTEKPRFSHRGSKGFISDALAEKPRNSRGGSLAEIHRSSIAESKPHFSHDTLSNRPRYSVTESVIDREMDELAVNSNVRPDPIGHNSPEHYLSERYDGEQHALLSPLRSGRDLPPIRAAPKIRTSNEFM